MTQANYVVGVVLEESTLVPFVEVCQKYNIPEALLVEMLEQGLFSMQAQKQQLNPKDLQRLTCACRLHKDLGINLAGVALALDLLDEMNTMRQELDILRKHF